jgi:hypothetical protein
LEEELERWIGRHRRLNPYYLKEAEEVELDKVVVVLVAALVLKRGL